MKRLLNILGPAIAIFGALGLILWGDAIVRIFEGVMTYQIVAPPERLPASLGELGWLTLSGIAFTLGLVVSCLATTLPERHTSVALAGRILQVVAGLLILVGTLPALLGIVGAIQSFDVIATSGATPRAEDLQILVQSAAPMLKVGSAILLAGVAALLVAGQLSSRTGDSQDSESPTNDQQSMLSFLAILGSSILAVVASILFVGIWWNGKNLSDLLANSATAPPMAQELGLNLSSMLNMALLAFIAVGCQGVLQVVASLQTRTRKPRISTD